MKLPRLAVAALAGVAVAAVCALGLMWLSGRLACDPPWAIWPDWAWPCLDAEARQMRDLRAMGWLTAAPVFAGLAVFLGIGLSRR